MTNLVIDINNILFRSIFTTTAYGSKPYTFNTQREVEQLMRKVSMDISFMIRQINPGRVIFCADSRSWRKDIKIEENEGYKGTRVKSTTINWENIYSTLDELCEILSNSGFIVSKVASAEADDLIALWAKYLLMERREHVIIGSSDEDVRQWVKAYWKDDNKKVTFNVFSCVFNPIAAGKNGSKKLFVPKHFNEWIESNDEVDIFNMSGDVAKEDFKKLLNEPKVKSEEVDGDRIGVMKMLCGDDGDNVPAIYTWLKNDKEKRITDSTAKKIIEKLKISDYIDLIDNSNGVLECLVEISETKPPFDINHRLKRQAQLVILHDDQFPKEIIETFNSEVNDKLDIKRSIGNDITMQMLLEDTRFMSETNKESSIFRELDNISKKLF